MKDKQTKRIEALDRIRRTLANLESTRTVLRSRLDVKIKASDGKPRTLADVRVAIILSSELLACRSHLEMVEKHIAAAERDAVNLKNVINRNRTYVL